jgi:hypothetical protein
VAHKSKNLASTQIYGLLSILVLGIGIAINYAFRPDLFDMATPYSLLGATDTTEYIFSASLIIAGLLFLYESHYIQNRLQRFGCYVVTLGFIIIAAVPINNGFTTDLIHGVGTGIALFGLLANLSIGIISRSPYLTPGKRLYYAVLFGVGLSSAIISILSSRHLGILDLQGYAEYSGLLVFAGWAIIDFGDKITKRRQTA